MIPALIGAAGGIANSFIGASQASKNRDMQWQMFNAQNAFNAQQAELSFNRNRDEWTRQFNMQNAYNDPSAQMQRYLNAGINPYMATGMFGNAASASASGSSPASSGSFPGGNFYSNNPAQDFFSGIQSSMASNLSVLDAIKGNKTLLPKINAENSIAESQISESAYKTAYNSLMLNNVDDIAAQDIAEKFARVNSLMAQIELSNASAAEKRKQLQLLNDTYDYQVNEWKNRNHVSELTWRQIENSIDISKQITKNTIRWTDQQIKESGQRINNMIGDLAIRRFLSGQQALLWKSQRNSLDARADYDWTMSTLGLPKILRGYDLKNSYQELLNEYQRDINYYYPILNAPTPEQQFNFDARHNAAAALLFGLGETAAGVGSVISPLSDVFLKTKGLGFPKFKGKH